jgi:hypothetical protein
MIISLHDKICSLPQIPSRNLFLSPVQAVRLHHPVVQAGTGQGLHCAPADRCYLVAQNDNNNFPMRR